MGELHLDILVDRMRREFSVEANIGKPQVAYREAIRNNCEIEGKFVRQSGGRGQYGHVWLKVNQQRMPVQRVYLLTKLSAALCQKIYSAAATASKSRRKMVF